MEYELILTTETTEAGQAIQMRDGKPLVRIDGEEVVLDYGDLRSKISASNAEAHQRREALEAIAEAVGLEVDVRTEAGIEALKARLSSYGADADELDKLRNAAAAGELDETADEKIKSLASTMRQEEFDRLQAQLEESKTAKLAEKVRADKAVEAHRKGQTITALRAFYDRSEKFREGALETFLMAAQQEQPGGYTWKPTGEVNASGVPTLALMDRDGQVKNGADGLTPMTLNGWTETVLPKAHPLLFKSTNGGPPGANPASGVIANKSAADMTNAELDAAARAVHS